MKFSERMGFIEPKSVIQKDYMDSDLQNGLWNTIYSTVFQSDIIEFTDNEKDLFLKIYLNFWKQDISAIDYLEDIYDELKEWYFDIKTPWFEKLDLIEYIVQNQSCTDKQNLIDELNEKLSQEISGYRFINGRLEPIISDEQIKSIENALETKRSSVARHLDSALEKLSDKQNPDYSKVIDESLKAVEDLCVYITKEHPDTKLKTSLGDALKEIENKSNIKMHGALKQSLSNLFGYASDAGIRHADVDGNNAPTQELAIFSLVTCSAFVNYLQVKADKAGIDLADK